MTSELAPGGRGAIVLPAADGQCYGPRPGAAHVRVRATARRSRKWPCPDRACALDGAKQAQRRGAELAAARICAEPASRTPATPVQRPAHSRPSQSTAHTAWTVHRQTPDLLAASKAITGMPHPGQAISAGHRSPTGTAPRSAPQRPGNSSVRCSNLCELPGVELWGFEPQTSCMP
jgi:hypothetical protein